MEVLSRLLSKFILIIDKNFPRNSLRGRLLFGSFWSTISVLVSRGLNLVAFIIVARIIGQNSYGGLAILQNTVVTIATFAMLGINVTATKYIASYRLNNSARTGNVLSFIIFSSLASAVVSSVGAFVLSDWISINLLNMTNYGVEVKVASGLIFFTILYNVLTGVISGFEEFRAISINSVISALLSFPVIVGLSFLYNAVGTIIGLVSLYLLNSIFSIRTIVSLCRINHIKLSINGIKKEIAIIWRFAIPASLGSIISTLTIYYVNITLIRQMNGHSQMAIMNVAQQWQSIILFLPTAINTMLLSIFSNIQSDGGKTKFWKTVRLSIIINGTITFIFALIISLFSNRIMSIYGEGFTDGFYVLIILSITAVLIALNNVIGNVIASSYSMWWGVSMNSFWAISMVLFSKLLIYQGAFGLAVTYLISYILHLLWQGYFLKVKMNNVH